jgi:prepilin peptidase CpaA
MFQVALALLMLWVIISDASRYIIPNTLNLAVLMLYAAAALLLPVAPLMALVAAVLVLVVGLGFFALGLMGGGDIKLLVVLTLWTGWTMTTPQFIFLTAIFGGLLVFVVLALRVILPPLWLKLRPTHNLPRLLTRKQPVPYGIAIAAAFLWLMWGGRIPGLG